MTADSTDPVVEGIGEPDVPGHRGRRTPPTAGPPGPDSGDSETEAEAGAGAGAVRAGTGTNTEPDGTGTGTGTAAGHFGSLLRELRTRAELTQEELSHRSGVSVRALTDMERSRTRGPQRRTVRALADALRLDAADSAALEAAARPGRTRPRATLTPPPPPSPPSPSPTPTPFPVSSAPEPTPPPEGTSPPPPVASSLPPLPSHRPLPPLNPLALPRDLGDFTARRPALDALRALAEGIDPARPPVSVVTGQPGLGKTAFAVHAAHELAPYFPDGRYVLDLRGMDPEPVAPREALARLLRALGPTGTQLPPETEERAGLLRSVLAERRVLLLLDNAADEEQVRPLLPGTGRSLTLVTSRQALAGLPAVHRTELPPLRREEAVELLVRILGPERVAAEAQAARDLAELCGYLPLAVRIAGQRLAARPGERLGKLAARLAAEEERLDGLRAGGLEVRAAFALSYGRLEPEVRRVFRRAALASGPGFGPETVGLLAGVSTGAARAAAEELADAGLFQPEPAAERYRFHDLLRLFAGERSRAEDTEAERSAALDRTAAWLLGRATAAALRFDAARHAEGTDTDPDPATAPADRPAARVWLESERDQWLAALRRAAATGRHRQVVDAAQAMHWFSDLAQHWEEWAEVFRLSVGAARALGSRREEAVHLNYLAWAHSMCLYDYPGAVAVADEALAVARELGDGLQTGWALGYGAGALHRLGRTEESVARFREAAARFGAEPSAEARLAELTVLIAMGQNLRLYGRAEEALATHRRVAAVCRAGIPGQQPDIAGMYLASARHQIGNDLAALGRTEEAETVLRLSVEYFEEARMPAWCEPARLDLGLVLRALGREAEALEALSTAHASLTALNSPRRTEAAAALGVRGRA
ncbi:helix-turn-helix domain-containing protein [Streptomyces sp. NPDC097619]|uniref:ATP-binding protein n=1 Tax=Streptomyces sp. NPDC097619 TaxID=3157228 RepID=UPI00332E8CD4